MPALKADVRFLGVDDGPFAPLDETVAVIGVVTRGAQYVEGVLSARVHVDGDDATDRILSWMRRSRFRSLVRAVFLNGIFLGGFNLVDVEVVHEATGLPVAAIVRSAPRPARVRRAMQAAFEDWPSRWRRVAQLAPVRLPGVPLWATVRGCTPREAARFVRAATVRGHLPEPLRLAHVIASGVVRGESRGKA